MIIIPIFDPSNTNNMKTAQTIINQLGGNKFIVMTGAKNFVTGDSMLMFSIGRGAKSGINKIKIELNNDLYNVIFFNTKKTEYTISNFENIYAEDLTKLFTNETGFSTSI